MKAQQTYRLRPIQPNDLPFLERLANDPNNWVFGDTTRAYTLEELKQYLFDIQDFFQDQQARFVLELNGKSIGLFDLFDFNPKKNEAGLGLIIDPQERKKGHGKMGLKLLVELAFEELSISKLTALVDADNTASQKLFEDLEFVRLREFTNESLADSNRLLYLYEKLAD